MRKAFFCLIPLSLLIVTAHAQVPIYSGRVVDIGGMAIPQVKVQLTTTCFNLMFPGGITYTDLKETNAAGEYSVSVPVLGGSSCMNRQDRFTMSKEGYVFDTGQSGSFFFPRGTHFGLQGPLMTSVSAANYDTLHASEMIVAGFGENLSVLTEAAATGADPPFELGGRRLMVTDQTGVERSVMLHFVSPTQINYIVPAGMLDGPALVKIMEGSRIVSAGFLFIDGVMPGIFTADATGKGLAAAVITRVKGDGSQSEEPVARFDATLNRVVAVPVDLGPEGDQVFLSLYGTGWRGVNPLSVNNSVIIGGTETTITYIGKQPTIAGLDQINVQLPRSLAGRGELTIEVTVAYKKANPVTIVFR